MSPDIAASIKARLLNRARATGEQLELVLVRYASERLLYRLGSSSERSAYVLKGASLLALWMHEPYRATRDIDLLGVHRADAAAVRAALCEVLGVVCPEDGLSFAVETLDVEPLREESATPGLRASLRAYLGKARIRIQVDFAFGDVVTPGPEEVLVPSMLEGLPNAAVLAYPRATAVAEKFEAMVSLGRLNSRMKDFHDVWALAGDSAFAGADLRTAILMCFQSRRTPWPASTPEALSADFYASSELQVRWRNYLRAGLFRSSPPADFVRVGGRITALLLPVYESICTGRALESNWAPGGPWS